MPQWTVQYVPRLDRMTACRIFSAKQLLVPRYQTLVKFGTKSNFLFRCNTFHDAVCKVSAWSEKTLKNANANKPDNRLIVTFFFHTLMKCWNRISRLFNKPTPKLSVISAQHIYASAPQLNHCTRKALFVFLSLYTLYHDFRDDHHHNSGIYLIANDDWMKFDYLWISLNTLMLLGICYFSPYTLKLCWNKSALHFLLNAYLLRVNVVWFYKRTASR